MSNSCRFCPSLGGGGSKNNYFVDRVNLKKKYQRICDVIAFVMDTKQINNVHTVPTCRIRLFLNRRRSYLKSRYVLKCMILRFSEFRCLLDSFLHFVISCIKRKMPTYLHYRLLFFSSFCNIM